jgi:ABC-type glutathione transport system ATPase component
MSVPAIRITNLTKDFRLGLRSIKLRAVDNLSFEVADNHVFGLLGPNGSGKSTTMKVILRDFWVAQRFGRGAPTRGLFAGVPVLLPLSDRS